MIICPRCGYQAPDGSPWCPRCGYGCPYPVPYQQQPQQMPAMYQPQPQQQIPAQYDVVDVPPQPRQQQPPEPPKKNKKKNKGCLKAVLIFLGVVIGLGIIGFFAVFISAIKESSSNSKVATLEAALSATPTFTVKPTQTSTSKPTITPYPTPTKAPTSTMTTTVTPTPLPDGWRAYTVQEGDNCWSIAKEYGISEEYLKEVNGMSTCNIGIGDVLLIPPAGQTGTGIRGSVNQVVATEAKCNIKGNINSKGERIYHCPGWRDYNKTDIDVWKGERWFCSAAEAEAAGWRSADYDHGACIN